MLRFRDRRTYQEVIYKYNIKSGFQKPLPPIPSYIRNKLYIERLRYIQITKGIRSF